MRTLAIVGRPNVGKSALFNRLAGRRISIVHDQPGVTRDRITAECRLGRAPFTLIDTGGIGADVDTDFTDAVRQEVEIAIEASNAILFMVDGQEGLTPADLSIATQLRRVDRPVILAVNKIDHDKHENLDVEFQRLGFSPMLTLSAEHNRGVDALLSAVEEHLPEPQPRPSEDEPAPAINIAVVGRPNVGKSSLVNAIVEDERTLVSNISGTTRDAIDIPYQRGQNSYTLIDTAGIRPRGKQSSTVEIFSVMRSEKTIRRADLCVLVIDASMGVTAQDKKIAGLIQEARKPCLIAVNKWDLLKEADGFGTRKAKLEETLERIRQELFFVDYAPVLLISARENEGLGRLFRMIERIRDGARRRIATAKLNRIIADALTAHPPGARNGKRFRIIYATQPDDVTQTAIPTPAILLFVNQADLMVESYRKYLDKRIRTEVAWDGLPIRFQFREREARGRRAHR